MALSNTLGGAFLSEGDALDLDAVAVAELQGAGGAGRRVDREELAPDPVHFVVVRAVDEHDGHTRIGRNRDENRVLYLNPASAEPRRFKLPIALAIVELSDHAVLPQIREIMP